MSKPSSTHPESKRQAPSPASSMHVATSQSSSRAKAHLLNLPTLILQRILSYLLVAPSGLLLHRDNSTPPTYRTGIATNILLVNHKLYHTSLPILYGRNTFTASSPATSYGFDAHLYRVPGKHKCLIRSIDLEIDWGRQLWSKFPLIAMRLGELRGLKSLKIHLIDGGDHAEAYGVQVQGKPRGTMQKREGHAAVAMLHAEKKMLKEMVKGIKALRVFELKGFEDVGFAKGLESIVRNGRNSSSQTLRLGG
ncbi:MAG: hypothetical protein Q9213_004673 [Squamulea squamosa]